MIMHRWRVGLCVLIWATSTGVHADSVEVEISGIEGEIFENVKSYMTFFQQTVEPDNKLPILTKRQLPKIDLSEQHIQRAHRLAPQEIRQAVQSFGYYKPTTRPILRRTEDGWLARYEIALGPPTVVTHIELSVTGEGRDDDDIKTTMSATGLAVGQRLSHRDYETTKKVLSEAAFAFGLKRAGSITYKNSQQFGLDNLGVETQPGSTSEQAAFVIGKYLAPKLYVSYGIGLF